MIPRQQRKSARKARAKAAVVDVLIVGGGIMGCASAWRLARAGLGVLVLERSVPGAEASSAAAGILGAGVETHAPGPMAELCVKSAQLYPRFARELARETAIDVEFRQSGVLRVAMTAAELRKLRAEVGWQRGVVRMLSREKVRAREPALSDKVAGGAFYAADARVDPRRLFKALQIAAHRAGARFQSGAHVRRVLCDDSGARGVVLDDGSEIRAHSLVVAAGSWTTLVEGTGLAPGRVVPARGQIIELGAERPLLASVVFGPGAYLVPRDDGRVLVGSTLEFVGYQRDVTAGAVQSLLAAALRLVPDLASASLRDSWSNFRPYTADQLPLIGPTPIKNLMLATGHYRNGILLAPITAEIIAALVRGRRPPLDLRPFSPQR